MKKILLSAVSAILAVCIFVSPAAALEFDGASSGGSGGSISASGGYAVEFASKKAVGYRFSLIGEKGNKVGTNIDIFRKATGSDYISLNKFSAKYSKYWLKNNYSTKNFTTTSGNTGTDDNYFDASLGVNLPETTDGMESWQSKASNLNSILPKITGDSKFDISDLTYGDKLLIEPIWCVKIDNKSCVLTVTEIGIVGGSRFGFNTTPSSSNTRGSWGFIASYTNRVYPNALYTPDGKGLWSGVSAAGSNLSFKNMITKGYGVAIAYTATTNCKVTVTYVPNGGTVYGSTSNVTKTYDINTTVTLPSAERNQYSFGGWHTSSSGGSRFGGSGGKYKVTKNVTMYAHWEQNTYTVRYYPGEGSGTHQDKYNQTIIYGTSTKLRSYTDVGFGKVGYHFKGYSVYRTADNKYYGYNSSGTLDWHAAKNIDTTRGFNGYELYCKDGSAQSVGKTAKSGYVDLTAQYEPNKITIKYNPNSDGNFTVDGAADYKNITGTMDDTILTYKVPINLRKNVFEKSGHTFGGGWVAFRDCDNTYLGYNSSGTLGWHDISEIDTSYGYNGFDLYADEQSVSGTAPSGTIYMFAVWNTNHLTIKYNPNSDGNFTVDGAADYKNITGTMSDTVYNYGKAVKLRNNAFKKIGYTFDKKWVAFRDCDNKYLGYNSSGTLGWHTQSEIVRYRYFNDGSIFPSEEVPNGTVYVFAVWTANQITIKYNPNSDGNFTVDGAADYKNIVGSMDDTVYNYGEAVKLRNNAFKKFGYTFDKKWVAFRDCDNKYLGYNSSDSLGWYTQSEIVRYRYFNDGSIFPTEEVPNGTVYVFAVWSFTKTYTVSYNLNGGSGTFPNQEKQYKVNINLHSDIPTRTGYTFLYWKEKATGTIYYPDAEYTNNAHAVMVAQWKPAETQSPKYTVSYDLNGGSGTFPNQEKQYKVNINLHSDIPTRTGYTFLYWKEKATGTIYYPDWDYTNNADAVMVAQWKAIQYIIRFSGNSGSGTMADMICTYDKSYNLTANAFTKTGYKFALWVDMNHSQIYYDKASVKNLAADSGAVITLTAMWSPIQYTVRFIGGGGSGTMDDMECIFDKSYNLTANAFAREGYTFKGWKCSLDGRTYINREQIKNMTTQDGIVIYMSAIWEINKQHTDLSIEANEIFGGIKQGYDICVSATVINNSALDITPELAASVRLTAENGSGIFDVQTLEGVIVPSDNIQLVWFKVYIPHSSSNDLTFTFNIVPNANVIDDNMDDNSSDRDAVSSEYIITNTDIPQYELNAENGFSRYLSSCGRTKDTFMWQYWVWKDGDFQIVTETYTPDDGYKVILTPTASAGWKEKDGENYKTRSGYGIEINAEFPMLSTLIGTLRLDILYPENNYIYSDTLYSSMVVSKVTESLYIASLPYYSETKYKNAHYTPMWFPDGDYDVEIHGMGLWTPVGEVTFTAGSTNTLTIEGSLWDDYYSTYYGNVKDD